MITNVMVNTCLNHEIIKNSYLIQAMKNSVCPKGNVIRRAIFFPKPNFPKFPNCGFNTRHDNLIVKSRDVTWSDTYSLFRKPNLPNIYRMFRSVDWTHDMIIVKWQLHSFDTSANFALWQMQHRFNPRKRVNDYQRYSMLTVLPLWSMSCTLGNSSSL